MIQLFINYSDGKITGYNTITPKDTSGCILVDDNYKEMLQSLLWKVLHFLWTDLPSALSVN